MQNFNLQQMSGNGYIIIPKLMFAEYMKNCDNHEGDIEAFLKLLMKVNYSETEYTDYWCKKSVCKRGESLRSYRSWSDVFHWSVSRTYRFMQGLKSKGVIEIISHDDTSALHIRVVDYESWVSVPKAEPDSVKRQKKEAKEKFLLFWNEYHPASQREHCQGAARMEEVERQGTGTGRRAHRGILLPSDERQLSLARLFLLGKQGILERILRWKMDTENRVSPQAPEIEEAIIGACMIEQEALPLVADKLRPEMFYVERHRLIFSALLAMYQAGTKVDILTVKEELLRRGTLEEAGGAYQVTLLSSRVASSAHIEYHAQIVHEKYLRREMIVGLNKLLACSLDDTLDIADTLVDAHNLLDRLEGEFGHNDCMRDMDTLMADTMKDAERRIIRSVNGVTGVPTGLTDLDRMTSGWQDGDLVVLAARPSVGKTALALHLARSAAMAGRAVVVYSLEMQGERLADRWLMAASEVNQRHWRTGVPSEQEMSEARAAAAELSRLRIHVDDSTVVSMDHVRSSARLLKSRGGV